MLKKFYCETDGPNWTNKTNWGSSGALSTWYGVTADHQGKVHALNLDGNMLSGKIPPELGNLTGLGALDLQNNQLTGSIPAELGNLTALLFLRLSNNMLSGSIPPELGMRPDLTVLDLGNNELSGEIPEELGDLTNLEELSLWSNQELMIQTQDLSLLRNQDRAALRIIYNANNGAQWRNNNNWLSDEPLGDWYGVTVNDDGLVAGLDLRSNNLREPVDGAFSGLPSLETLILSGNRALTGELPLGLMDLSDLMALNVRCTGVSVPDNEDFRTWLAGITFTSSYCPPPPPPPPPPESGCEGLQEDRGEDGLAISPDCVGTSLIVIGSEEGEYITIELSVAGNEEPEEVPSIILSSSLLERVETVSFDLRIPSEEELPEGLRLGGFAAEAGIGNSMLEEDETVTVCLPAPYFEDDEESMPRLYRYEEGWNPLSGSGIETVNGKRSVCTDVSFLPSLLGVFVEIPEPPEEESDGGCSIASGGAGRSGSFNVAFNLFLIMFSLVGAFRRRRQICVHRTR